MPCGAPAPVKTVMDFLWGFVDGAVVWFVLVANAFGADFGFYDTTRAGQWYNFGFLIGSGAGAGSVGGVSRVVR